MTGSLLLWVRQLRVRQWPKNGFVLAPLFFSGQAARGDAELAAVSASALFCLLASGGYCVNDVLDRDADRAHPSKRARPVAAGTISARRALVVGLVLIAGSVVGGFLVGALLGALMVAYLVLSILYNAVLKSVVILDVFAIGSFFVLRMMAGAAAIDAVPSVWLLLCGSLVSLYLAFTKRRQELGLLGVAGETHRSVLGKYTTPFLDQVCTVLLAVTLVSYIMYTIESETAALVANNAMVYSTSFVLYGLFRYLYLVYGEARGGEPGETLFGDPPLLIAAALWIVYCSWLIYG